MSTLDIDTVLLRSGSHPNRSNGLCLMEVVSWVAGEPHSDRPTCACPVLAAFGRHLNDANWPSDQDRTDALKPAIALLVGSANPAREKARRYALVDLAVRKWAPISMDHAKMPEQAAALRALTPIVDDATQAEASTVL